MILFKQVYNISDIRLVKKFAWLPTKVTPVTGEWILWQKYYKVETYSTNEYGKQVKWRLLANHYDYELALVSIATKRGKVVRKDVA